MISAVYAIKNITNGKMYIGQTINYNKRTHDHRYKLTHNMHENKALQQDWNKYGKDSFVFFILEYLPERFLCVAEEWWINYFDAKENGYNYTDGGLGTKGMIPWNLNKQMSEETRRKISIKAARRTGELNPFFGKRHSDSVKQKLSKLRSIPVIDLDSGDVYPSAKHADEHYNGRSGNVTKAIKGRTKTAYGKRWAYYKELNNIDNG